jgi:hypothetical protein
MNVGAQSQPQETLAQEPLAQKSTLELRIQKLEAEVGGLRQDIAGAIAAQEQLHGQLSIAIEKLSELLRQRTLPNAPASPARPPEPERNYGLQLGRLESRMRGVEQRLERVTGQVAGILESRIWKTLVKGSGFLLKLVR